MIEVVSIKASTDTEPGQGKEINLLPCPFCGGEGWLDAFYNSDKKRMRCHAACVNAGCLVRPSGKCADTIEEAVEAWNTRAGGAR